MSTRNAINPGDKDQQNKWDIFLSRRGFLYMINKCRKPTPNLINLTKCLEVELHKKQVVVERARHLEINHAGL